MRLEALTINNLYMRMCSVRHYMGQVAQHELDSEGPMDPERKIQQPGTSWS